MIEKEYIVPPYLVEKGKECAALVELRALYIRLPFGYNRAKRLTLQIQDLRNEVTRGLAALYPELVDDNEFSWNFLYCNKNKGGDVILKRSYKDERI